MALIERYILRRVTGAFLLILFTLIGTVWVTQVLRELDVVTAKGQTIGLFLWMTVLAIPSIIPMIAPFAVLVSILAILNAMNADSETAIISSSGASKARIVRPVLVFALIVAAGAATFHHALAPAGLAALRELVTEVRADLIATLVKDGGFRTVETGLTLHIREKAADGSFRDIFVNDDRNAKESLQYTAKQGLLIGSPETAYLVMREGSIVRKERQSGAINIVDFDTYAFDLSQFRKVETIRFFKPRERTTGFLLAPPPDDHFYQQFPERFASELHDRFSAPLYSLAFALLALAYGASPRTNRQDRGFAAIAPISICVALRSGGFLAFGLAEKSPDLSFALYLPPIVGLLLGVTLLGFDVRLSLPRFAERMLDTAIGLVGPILDKLRRRFIPEAVAA